MTDRTSILAACEDRLGDRTQLLVAADWFAESGEPAMETACRWMAEYDKHPSLGYRFWLWTCFGGLCGPVFKNGVAHALPRRICRRIGFWEWKGFKTYEVAVEVLAKALVEGWVECVGDPTQCEPETLEEIRLQGEELRRTLGKMGVPNE